MEDKLAKITFQFQRRMEKIIRREGGVGLANGWVGESDGHGLRALRDDTTLDDLRGHLAQHGHVSWLSNLRRTIRSSKS